jgi:DNA-directed RNA polymerase subunit RPC12/RpoP
MDLLRERIVYIKWEGIMVRIIKICPKCNEEIVINQLNLVEGVDEVSIDEIIGLGIDCEYCGIHIDFNEEYDDEEDF